MANQTCEKLSPSEFQQLQDFAAYSNKTISDVLEEFEDGGCLSDYDRNEDIDLQGFQKFLDCFLEVSTPEDLSRHLFQTFVHPPDKPDIRGGALQNSRLSSGGHRLVSGKSGQFYDKLHGITDKLQQLGTRERRGSEIECPANNNHPVDTSPPKCLSPRGKSNGCNSVQPGVDLNHLGNFDLDTARVPLKEISAYLTLLEGGKPEDKLEFMFRMYDTDKNGYLDQEEMDSIVDQMMIVAEYMGWETNELRPILSEMMEEIDYDSDGTVTLEEWKKGGMTTIPLLVLLGLDQNYKEDGNHLWRLKHYSKPAYCNLCLNILSGMGRKGLSCTLCKYTVHERCVQRAPASCISTYVKSLKTNQKMIHHWVEGNTAGKCSKCKKTIKSYNGITGLHCRWCHTKLHNRCASQVSPDCTLGPHKLHVLPPTAICPTVLDRQRSVCKEKSKEKLKRSESCQEIGPGSFQISPVDGSQPLLVFVNPKSGGRQGAKLYRKFLYHLNPRQVYNLGKGGPKAGLQMFREVENIIILVCGGDGTVGWVLDILDKTPFVHQPTVAVIPLGTGNDLARCLRWGGGYEGESLWKVINKISQSSTVMLDRWSISVSDEERDKSEPIIRANDKIPYNIINNYFSIGVDAAICSKFHAEREKNPQKFNNRMKNKLWYFEYATSEQFSNSCKNLHEHLEIICDGVSLHLTGGPQLQGIALLNIPSTHGGTNMWGDSKSKFSRKKVKKDGELSSSSSLGDLIDLSSASQDIGDKMIEVIGLENCLHMGQVRTGLRSSGKRLAQCSHIVIRTKKQFPMQIDGEPWNQPPCTIEIAHKNQVPMLLAPPPKSRSFFNFLSHATRKSEDLIDDY